MTAEFLCTFRWQHPQHSLLGDVRDQDGPHESVRPAALVLLSVSASRHSGEGLILSL